MTEIFNKVLPIVETWLRKAVREEVKKALEEQQQKAKPTRMYTREEVCRLAHITLPTLWKRVADGKITPTKNGRRVLFSEDEVRKFINQ